MSLMPQELYGDLMLVVRQRLDIVTALSKISNVGFAHAESAAFHGRKIVEGIAFACLIATENGKRQIPRDAKGQWNAEKILKSLEKRGLTTFPSPSIFRDPTPEEREDIGARVVFEGVPAKRISVTELIAMYQRLHRWLHELNPYVADARDMFYQVHGEALWSDLAKIDLFMESHAMTIGGIGFICVLRDSIDGMTKVILIQKIGNLPSENVV
jgi:hypothetical protein